MFIPFTGIHQAHSCSLTSTAARQLSLVNPVQMRPLQDFLSHLPDQARSWLGREESRMLEG